jgi:hypothetical protein
MFFLTEQSQFHGREYGTHRKTEGVISENENIDSSEK